jgi:phospholipid/cholesterol/gamma-HCH transport system ATP-binding protein
MIEFRNVKKSFGTKVVLDGLSMIIPTGQTTVIVGKSGEGKSVTIKHILGLLKPDSGHVFVDGVAIDSLDHEGIKRHRRRIGMLFQNAALFDSLSVAENIMFPLREHTKLSYLQMREIVKTTLDHVGLSGIEDKLPNQLSTGEKKRVGLARALAPKPDILLYDEPTTGMDPLVSEMIDQLIVRIGKQRPELTSIVISHDLKAALDIADKIVMLYKGKTQLSGTAEEFRKTEDPIVRQFFGGRVEGPMEFV